VGARFPFPSYPRGWFVVALSSDVAPREVKTVHYFGQDIVLFRGEDGSLSAIDKTCPHLGAHLGGGRVDGNCLRCPFHDWAFDGSGSCVDVPYAKKIPPKAAVQTWPLREQNGVVFVFHCPRGEPPTWEVPPLDEEGWMPNRGIRWEIRSHPQEIAENTVDIAHLGPVHHALAAEFVELEQREHFMRAVLRMTVSGAPIQMPDEINDVELDVHLHGLGILVSSTHVVTAGLRTRQRIYPTPVDEERVAIFGVNNVKAMPDPGYTREIDEIFFQAFITDFPRDFPIWEKKAYLDRPLLVAGDGPIGRYRRWARQFYDGPTPSEMADARLGERVRAWLARLVRRPEALPGGGLVSVRMEGAARSQSASADAAGNGKARFGSVDAYFEGLEARFDRDAAGDLEAVFQWVLTGQDARSHFVTIKDGAIHAVPGVHPDPTVAIEMSAADYLQLINGDLSGPLAFSTGRGKLRGPVRLALRMQKLFPLDRVV
jgi:phenylpropionate dioxygenase-like ring-hydroxylating dioxygenase large terminal subunit/putative sterol carrier protein